MKTEFIPTEHQIQSAFFDLLRHKYRDIHQLTFAIPNGGLRYWGTARKLKAEGVKPGVSDVFVARASNGKHGLYIEFKAGKNTLTDLQKEWGRLMVVENYAFAVCYSVDEAIKVLTTYLYKNNG